MIHKIHNSHDMSVQWRLLLERHVCNTSIDGLRGARIAPEGIIHLKKIINNHNFNGLNPSQCEKFISTHRLLMKTPNWNHSLWSWFLSLTQRCLKIQLSWAPFYSKTPDTIGKCCEHHIMCDWNDTFCPPRLVVKGKVILEIRLFTLRPLMKNERSLFVAYQIVNFWPQALVVLWRRIQEWVIKEAVGNFQIEEKGCWLDWLLLISRQWIT